MIFYSVAVFQCPSTDLTIDCLIDTVLVFHMSCNVGFVEEIVANSTLNPVCNTIHVYFLSRYQFKFEGLAPGLGLLYHRFRTELHSQYYVVSAQTFVSITKFDKYGASDAYDLSVLGCFSRSSHKSHS